MPYKMQDALQDEINFLQELAKVEEKDGRIIAAHTYKAIANSHQRVLNRLDSYDYSLKVVDGNIKIAKDKTNRKTLEEEYPALKKAAEQYNLVKDLVDSSPD